MDLCSIMFPVSSNDPLSFPHNAQKADATWKSVSAYFIDLLLPLCKEISPGRGLYLLFSHIRLSESRLDYHIKKCFSC